MSVVLLLATGQRTFETDAKCQQPTSDMCRATKAYIDCLMSSSARARRFAVDLSSVSLSSERLLLKSFTGDDAREAFLAATPTIARFMSWEPAPSLEVFERIWQSWIPKMRVSRITQFGGLVCEAIEGWRILIWFAVRRRATGLNLAKVMDLLAPDTLRTSCSRSPRAVGHAGSGTGKLDGCGAARSSTFNQ